MNDYPRLETERYAPRRERFVLRRFGAIKHDAENAYLVKDLLCSTGLVVVWGAPKCAKSFWVFDLLMHVARGLAYRGHRVRQGTIVYCALEGQKGFERRIEAFRRGKLADSPEADPPFYLMSTPLSLVRDVETLIADIKVQIGDTKPAAICVDTLNRSLEGSESSDEDMARYIKAADAIREAFDCLVVIVHHCGHEGQRPRGHSSLMGALDIQIAVRRDADDNIVAELELAKDGETGLTFLSRLKVVEIGFDQDGDPITSCIIEPVEASEAVTAGARKAWSKSLVIFKRALDSALCDAGKLTRPRGDMPEVRAVDQEAVRTEFHRLYLTRGDEKNATVAKNKAFVRCAREAVDRSLMCSLAVGPDLGQTVFWISS
jgi:AAA domain-containing protein